MKTRIQASALALLIAANLALAVAASKSTARSLAYDPHIDPRGRSQAAAVGRETVLPDRAILRLGPWVDPNGSTVSQI